MEERTANNVHDAFVGEAKANQRLLEYAKKAEEEEFPRVAHLFRAVASSESVHSRRHFRLLESIHDTQSNLEQAFQQENMVNGNYYPKMIKEAEEDGEKVAALVFSHARDVEAIHSKLYKKVLDHIVEEKFVEYHVCSVCGYINENEPPDSCPICGAPKDKFYKVE